MEILPDFGKLEIIRIERETSEFRTYEMQWTTLSYSKMRPHKSHTMHNVLIGNETCVFQLYKKETDKFSGQTNLILTLIPWPSSTTIRFSIIGANNREILPDSPDFLLNAQINERQAHFLETPDLIVEDTLTISVSIMVSVRHRGLSIFESIEKQDTVLGILFQSGRFADLQIEVGEETFQAHTAVLCARSTVFAAMFENNLNETIEKRFRIDNADAESVKEMLNYIYTGETKELNLDLASNLFQLAGNYSLKGLRFKVTSFLMRTISMNHALRILLLADMHNHRDLKDFAAEFIGKNLSLAMRHRDWESFRKFHNDLFEDVLKCVAEL